MATCVFEGVSSSAVFLFSVLFGIRSFRVVAGVFADWANWGRSGHSLCETFSGEHGERSSRNAIDDGPNLLMAVVAT